MEDRYDELVTRREFLKKSSLGLAGAGLFLAGMHPKRLLAALENINATRKASMYYRKLGKTDLLVSEIVFNGGKLEDPAVLSYAMDFGVNYVDTAPVYDNSEALIAKVLKLRRDELVVATKWEVNELYSAKELIASVDNSLKNLQVDTIDIIQTWAAMRVSQVNHEPVFEAFETLKQAGKVRYLGITSHRNQLEVAKAVVANGRYDMMLLGYNADNREQLDPVIEQAAAGGIGVIAQHITDYYHKIAGPFSGTKRGAVEMVLKNPSITAAVMDMTNMQEVNELVQVPALLRK